MSGRTKVLSVHRLRRTARKRERELTAAMNRWVAVGAPAPKGMNPWPRWARGVRVEKAGLFQWAVVATEDRGH